MMEQINLIDSTYGVDWQAKASELFDEIADPVNWKESIWAIIPSDEVAEYSKAVEFYTGGGLDIIEEYPNWMSSGKPYAKVVGKGYYYYIGS
jgi:hypothetical protein